MGAESFPVTEAKRPGYCRGEMPTEYAQSIKQYGDGCVESHVRRADILQAWAQCVVCGSNVVICV